MGLEDGRLILAPGLLIVPAAELAPDLRRRLDLQPDQFALFRPNTRTTAQLIDGDAARLLQEFRAARTIPEALAGYCRAERLDPAETLAAALPFLLQMRASGVLVATGSEEARSNEASLPAGALVGAYEVIRPIWIMDDTEVYQVRDPRGESFALKICRNGAPFASLMREAAILRHLGGAHTPDLREEGSHNGRRFLCMQWCDGEPVFEAAERWRRDSDSASPRLLGLCCSVLRAYVSLHARGVVHGDVRSRNVLVDEHGAVRLLDFGLARPEDVPSSLGAPDRGGIGFHLEPECAQAYLLGEPPPDASQRGEQYAVATLLYLLLAGKPYLDFRLERREALRQIVEERPLPFSSLGAPSQPEVERVLGTALSKDAERRFSSMREFERHFRAAVWATVSRSNAGESAPAMRVSPVEGAEAYLQSTLDRLDEPALAGPGRVVLSPQSSVGLGAAGVAYLFYRAACLQGDARLLAVADQWAHRAERALGDDDACLSPQLHIGKDTATPASLYYGECGVHCVRVLISHAMGDAETVERGLQSFLWAARLPHAGLDLTSGSASALLGSALLFEALAGSSLADTAPLERLACAIQNEISSALADQNVVRPSHEISFLGVAHGWAGILYATLRWASATGAAAAPGVEGRLRQLVRRALPAGRGVYWRPSLRRDESPWVGWCHGSAGYVHLWALASRLYRDESFLSLAEQAAWHTWEHPNREVSHLCCGVAGQAEALLALYQRTGDAAWLDRAGQLGKLAFADARPSAPSKDSLYKGEVGIALLALDLAQPDAACMPLFGSEGWPPPQRSMASS